MSLKGKIVFITGASGGIGAATALAFAAEGARLLLAARRVGKLAEVAAQALYGALAAAASAPVRHSAPAKARTVHQTSSKELVRVLGHRCLKKLRRR